MYRFKLLKGYEFTKANLFNNYVYHFNNKRTNVGAQKAIVKLHLNVLYSYFGRRQDFIETVNINNTFLPNYLSSRRIISRFKKIWVLVFR